MPTFGPINSSVAGLRYKDCNLNQSWLTLLRDNASGETIFFHTEFQNEVGIAELTAAEKRVILLRQISLV